MGKASMSTPMAQFSRVRVALMDVNIASQIPQKIVDVS